MTLCPLSPAINFTVDATKITSSSSARVDLTGSLSHVITNDEIKDTFALKDVALKDAIEAHYGGRPDEVYFKSPTSWNVLHQTYGWSQVMTNIIPKSVKVLGLKTQVVTLSSREFVNDSNSTTVYNTGVTHEVKESITSTWLEKHSTTLNHDVKYVFDVDFGKREKAFFSYGGPWGEDYTVQRTEILGSKSGVSFALMPGQSAVANLQASRGVMELEVIYDTYINGDLACNYVNVFQGHHFWSYPVSVASTCGMSTRREITQTIKILFYSDANIIVTDKETDNLLFATAVLIRRGNKELPSCAIGTCARDAVTRICLSPAHVHPKITYACQSPLTPHRFITDSGHVVLSNNNHMHIPYIESLKRELFAQKLSDIIMI